MKALTIAVMSLLATSVETCSAGTASDILGFYEWGGQYPASASEGIQKIVGLGARKARVALTPRNDIDYHQGTACSPLGSLATLAQQPDLKSALDNPNIDVVMFTAYDFTTFGDCETQRYLQPGFYTPDNIAALVQEYSDLTLYLYQAYAHTYKRFIVSNWEGDNSVYCGKAYDYATDASFRAYCDGNYAELYYGNASPADSLEALKLWLRYRQQGIADGRARAAQLGFGGMRVYFAPEFSITRALHDGGFKSVLYDILPYVPFDYISYSAYESINAAQPGDTLTADLNTIRDETGSTAIIVGEMGFSRSAWGADAVNRTNDVLAAASAWGVAYVFVWNLYDSSSTQDFGVYGTDGMPTTLAGYYQGVLQGTAAAPKSN